jgi:hypothetical protein
LFAKEKKFICAGRVFLFRLFRLLCPDCAGRFRAACIGCGDGQKAASQPAPAVHPADPGKPPPQSWRCPFTPARTAPAPAIRPRHPPVNTSASKPRKFGADLRKFGTDLRKFGTDLRKFGTDLRKFGADLRKFGMDLRKFGTDLRKFGVDLRKFGMNSPEWKADGGTPGAQRSPGAARLPNWKAGAGTPCARRSPGAARCFPAENCGGHFGRTCSLPVCELYRRPSRFSFRNTPGTGTALGGRKLHSG